MECLKTLIIHLPFEYNLKFRSQTHLLRPHDSSVLILCLLTYYLLAKHTKMRPKNFVSNSAPVSEF